MAGEEQLRIEHDVQANALYVYLRDAPYAYGKSLDDARHIDYGADDQPIGVEFLNVSRGVKVDGVPEQRRIGRALEEGNIKVFA